MIVDGKGLRGLGGAAAVAVLCLAVGSSAFAATWFVAVDGDDTGGSGGVDRPFRSIGRAVEAGSSGDTIVVRPGTYAECVDTSGKALKLLASDLPVGTLFIPTVMLEGGSVCGPVVRLTDGSSIEGFTVQGGVDSGIVATGRVTIRKNLVRRNATAGSGGGIRADGEVTIEGNRIGDEASGQVEGANTAARGGGIYLAARGASTVRNNRIIRNRVTTEGGGIWVEVDGAIEPVRSVLIESNLVQANRASGEGSSGGRGGGLAGRIRSSAGAPTPFSATLTLRGNAVLQNLALAPLGAAAPASGAGIWLSAEHSRGESQLVLSGNAVRQNISEGGEGGTALVVTEGPDSDTLDVRLEGNSFTSNVAALTGGGIGIDVDVVGLQAEATIGIALLENEISGNVAEVSGGGLAMILGSSNALGALPRASVVDNTFRNNSSRTIGGGASFTLDASDAGATSEPPATALELLFRRNLVDTTPRDADPEFDERGGGVAATLRAVGNARVRLEIDAATIVRNRSTSRSGGIEVESYTDWNEAQSANGSSELDVRSSIVAFNEGYGIGGPPPGGTGRFSSTIVFNDVYGNLRGSASSDYQGVPPPPLAQNLSVDPLLNEETSQPGICSETVDAGDPDGDASQEPLPSGGRLNQGHRAGTALATISLPDPSGDRRVDGIDILRVAMAFGADRASTDPQVSGRYRAASDIDLDGDVDGVDLAFVAGRYGTICP